MDAIQISINKPMNKDDVMYVYFPGGSDGKASACNAGDRGSIPGSGRSLEKEMATHSSILAWGNPMDRGAWYATVHGVAKSRTRLSNFNSLHFTLYYQWYVFRLWSGSCVTEIGTWTHGILVEITHLVSEHNEAQSYFRKSSVRDKEVGKKWIYLERSTFDRCAPVGHIRKSGSKTRHG